MKTTFFTLVTLAFLGLSTTYGQVGIGTTNPDPSAILEVDVSSLTDKKGFLPPRVADPENDITDPATGLMVYNTTTQCLEFWGGFGWTSLCANVEPGDVLNSQTGRIWMDRNLGALRPTLTPRSDYPDDSSYIAAEEDSFGDLYQWGRRADDHESRTSGVYNGTLPTSATDSGAWDGEFINNQTGDLNWLSSIDNNLWQGVNGVNNPCPSGYKIPTEAEWQLERDSWGSTNSAGAFGSVLKLPLAGDRGGGGIFFAVGSQGDYQSSNVQGGFNRMLRITTTDAFMDISNRFNARSVRCIKEE